MCLSCNTKLCTCRLPAGQSLSLWRPLSPWPPEASVLRCSQREFWFSLPKTGQRSTYRLHTQLRPGLPNGVCSVPWSRLRLPATPGRVMSSCPVSASYSATADSAHGSFWSQSSPSWASSSCCLLLPSITVFPRKPASHVCRCCSACSDASGFVCSRMDLLLIFASTTTGTPLLLPLAEVCMSADGPPTSSQVPGHRRGWKHQDPGPEA